MEVIVTNNTENEIFVKICKDDLNETLLPQKKHVFSLNEQEKTYLEIGSKVEDPNKGYYEICSPCSVDISGDGIYQINFKNDDKKKLNKLNIDEYSSILKTNSTTNKLQTIHKDKNFNFKFDQFKKDEFVFINNDKSNVYVFKELRFSKEKKIEALILKKDSSEEKIINCLKTRIDNSTRLKIIVIHSEDIMFEKFIVININDKIDEIYKYIQERFKDLVIGKSFRLIFKNVDISPNPLDEKLFREMKMINSNDNLHYIVETSNENFEKQSCSNEDSNGLSEEEENEESDCCENESEGEDSESIQNNEEGLEETLEEKTYKSEKHSYESKEESKSDTKKDDFMKKKQSSKDKPVGKMGEKTLIELNFNFENDYLCIIPPEINFKIFNMCEANNSHSLSLERFRNIEMENILIFSKDLIMKNLCISWYNSGAPCNSSYPEFDLMLYEMDIDPIEKANKIETYYNYNLKEDRYKDLESVWDKRKAGNYKLLFEKRKIRPDNCGEDLEFKKKINSGFFIPTNEMKISANKIYCFIFKLGENYYDYSCLYHCNQKIMVEGEEDLLIYGYARMNYYFILGFNYKFNLMKLEDC